MTINKQFFIEKHQVQWGGQDVCEVRGLTPDDITRAMTENAADMETVFQIFERDKMLGSIDINDPESVSRAVEGNTQAVFGKLMTSVPNLVAKLIAIACDSPDQWQFVKANYVLPLQLEIVTQVARLTFVDGNGFKAFVGNVLALAENVRGGQRQIESPSMPSPDDTDG